MQPTIVQDGDRRHVQGTSGNDVIILRHGRANVVRSREGDDRICDRSSSSTIHAGSGNDRVSAGKSRDTIYAGDGEDIVKSGLPGRHGDESYGGSGDDRLDGVKGMEFAYGEHGDDTILRTRYADGGPGADTIYGKWLTVVVYETAIRGVVVDLNDGTATGQGHDTFPVGRIQAVIGSPFDDDIEGTDANYNSFAGNTGDDVIRGLGGYDTLYGQQGDDRLLGGEGDDAAAGGRGTDECEAEHRDHCEVELPPA